MMCKQIDNISKRSKRFRCADRGFIAVIAVTMLSSAILAFSILTFSEAFTFRDTVKRRELRIQVRLNAESCLEQGTLMASRNYFISGRVTVGRIGCQLDFINDLAGNVSFNVQASLEGISAGGKRVLKVVKDIAEVVEEETW